MNGRILVVNTGSTSTKIGFFDSGKKLFEQNLAHSADSLAKYHSVMDQDLMRRDAITDFLLQRGIPLETIDVVMARGGLVTPIKTGVYEVGSEMRAALISGKDGVHACNLSALIADDIVAEVNKARSAKGSDRLCHAYIADPPMADEMWPEITVGGRPEFRRRTLFHALNSRAMVRRYARENGVSNRDVTVIVAHLGGGTSVSLHDKGFVIDTNDALGGDGPISPERAGTVPAFPLVDMCFSGKYSKDEIKKMLVGRGGAVSYFGTNDFRELARRASEGDKECDKFIKGYCFSVAKYIGALSTVTAGQIDAVILTGGIAFNADITEFIASKVRFIAPVVVYPGENELESLAENGYGILSGEFPVKQYSRDGILD